MTTQGWDEMDKREFSYDDEYSRRGGDNYSWSDSDLIAICREGDTDAYEPLVRRYAQDVYRMNHALVGNPEDAYDLTEQAFITAFPEVRNLKLKAPYSVVLFRAAIEGSTRLLRGEGLYSSRESEFGFEMDWRGPGGSEPFGGRDVFCSVEARRASRGADAAVACLPMSEKLALVLRDVVGFSVEQVGRVLQWPLRKVRTRLAAARQMVYERLHPRPEASPDHKHCDKSEGLVSDYLEGQLHPKIHDQLTEHFRECRECGDEVKAMERMLSEIAAIGAHKMPGDVWRSVGPRIATGDIERPKPTPTRRRGLLWRLIAMITLFLGLVFGGGRLIMDNIQPRPSPVIRRVQQVPTTPLPPAKAPVAH